MKRFYLFMGMSIASLLSANQGFTQTSNYVNVIDALELISKQYNVKFVYDSDLLGNKKVTRSVLTAKETGVEALLKAVLGPVDLGIKKNSEKHYTIVKAPQEKNIPQERFSVSGNVSLAEHSALAFANVSIPELSLSTQTDRLGNFEFLKIPSGQYTIQVNHLGVVPIQERISINAKTSKNKLMFFAKENILSIAEIQVTAQENKNTIVTSSLISDKAIEHLQANSLTDVLQLLPGKLMENPNLTSVNKISLRQISTDNVGSLGTALYMNGVPVSNNANMQMIGNARSGVLANYQATAGAGMDFRQFTADNISTVEVMRGISSVEYGDLTSGVVLVQTKSGKQALNLKARINPTTTQIWAGQGLDLGESKGLLNVDFDYTSAVSDQRFNVNRFDRYTGNVKYENRFLRNKSLLSTSSFSVNSNIGQRKIDADDEKGTMNKADDISYRFQTSGKWNINNRFSKTLNYSFSSDYTVQRGYQQEFVSNNIYPITNAMSPVIAQPATLVPSLYLGQLWVDGQSLNIFGKITNSLNFKTDAFLHNVLMGVEWRTDGNFGKGKYYDYSRPPASASASGSRMRSYKDIPNLNMLSAYIEDRISGKIANRNVILQLGARFDNVQPTSIWSSKFETIIAPRVNLSYELIPHLTVKGGYGIAAKAPTLAYLNPQDAYYDHVVLNHFTDNPNERLALVTTEVYNRQNNDLKMAYSTKKEVGFSWREQRRQFHLTAYHEFTKNGYEYMQTINSTHIMGIDKFQVSSRPVNQQPMVDPTPIRRDQIFTDYSIPTNGRELLNRGIEFDFDFGMLQSTHTSFVFNGAYMQSRSTLSLPYLSRYTGAGEPKRLGVYAKGRGTEQERFNSTLRIIQHIPQFRLVASMAIQTIWLDKNSYLNYEKIAQGYLNKETGQYISFSESERALLDPSKALDLEVTQNISAEYYITESWKPLWTFNFRLTKEIGSHMGFAFLANNAFMSKKQEQSNRWTTQYVTRGQGFFFGTELNFKF